MSAAAPARPLGRGQPRPGRRASRPRPPTQRSYRGGPAVQRCAGGAEWSPGRQASRNSTRLRGSSLLPGCAHGAERGPGRRASRYPTRPRRSSALPGTSLAAARRRRGCRGSMPRTGRRHGQRRRREGSLPAYAATQPGLTRGCDGWQVHCSCRLASSCGRRTCPRGPPAGGQEPAGSQAADRPPPRSPRPPPQKGAGCSPHLLPGGRPLHRRLPAPLRTVPRVRRGGLACLWRLL